MKTLWRDFLEREWLPFYHSILWKAFLLGWGLFLFGICLGLVEVKLFRLRYFSHVSFYVLLTGHVLIGASMIGQILQRGTKNWKEWWNRRKEG